MISRICGKVTEKGANFIIMDLGGISYEVLVPQTVMQRLEESI